MSLQAYKPTSLQAYKPTSLSNVNQLCCISSFNLGGKNATI